MKKSLKSVNRVKEKAVAGFKGKRLKKSLSVKNIAVIAAVIVLVAAAAVLAATGKKAAMIILGVDTHACNCVKKRCVNMEKEVKAFLSESGLEGRAGLKVFDRAKNNATDKVIQKYDMGLIPYLVLVDASDAVVYRANAFEFNRDALKGAIESLTGGKK
jgi:hypothetical protein